MKTKKQLEKDELKEIQLKEIREFTWDCICDGYGDSKSNIKANCTIDIDEIVDLVFKATYKRVTLTQTNEIIKMIEKGCGENWDNKEKVGSYVTECFEGNLCYSCNKHLTKIKGDEK